MFTEANTVEDFIHDLLSGPLTRTMRNACSSYDREQMARASTGIGWQSRARPLMAVAKEDL
jgi:hypothetical protein